MRYWAYYMDPAIDTELFLTTIHSDSFFYSCDIFTISMCSIYNPSQHNLVILEQTNDVASNDILRMVTCIYESETRMYIFIKRFHKLLKSLQVFAKQVKV